MVLIGITGWRATSVCGSSVVLLANPVCNTLFGTLAFGDVWYPVVLQCDLFSTTSVDQWDTPRRPLRFCSKLLYARSSIHAYNSQCAVWAEAQSIDSTTSQLNGFEQNETA